MADEMKVGRIEQLTHGEAASLLRALDDIKHGRVRPLAEIDQDAEIARLRAEVERLTREREEQAAPCRWTLRRARPSAHAIGCRMARGITR